jgi:hypothetical protein
MKKSLNPFGEGECGMLLSAWEGTGRRTRKEQGAPEDKQGSKRVCSKAVHRDDGAEETEKRTKEEKRLSTKVKSRKTTRRVKRGG